MFFGSASRKEETKESDIDLLIITNEEIDLIKNKKEAEVTSKHCISLFQSTLKEFKNNSDDIIIQAKKQDSQFTKNKTFMR